MNPVYQNKKILIVGPAWIGDMVMAQVLFKCLAEQGATIDVLAPKWTLPLLQRMPQVHKSFVIAQGHGELGLRSRYQLAKVLRTEKYDCAIILPNSFKSALIPYWAKIPYRVGWLRELRGILLTDKRKLDKKRYPLMIERFLALAYPSDQALPWPYPRPSLQVDINTVNATQQKFNLSTENKITVLCPGAEFGPAKRWPEEHYAQVANELLDQGETVWLMGSANDSRVTQAINQLTQGRCIDLAGKTNLAEAIDLMSLAQQVVTNDSGLMHIAAALDKPLVAIYGSSDPRFTPPLSDKVQIVQQAIECSPCFKRVCPLKHMDCLQQLHPDKVLTALTELPVTKLPS